VRVLFWLFLIIVKWFCSTSVNKTNIEKDEMVDMFTDSHSICSRWRKHFSQLLNLQMVNEVRQTEKLTAEQLVPETCACEMIY